MSRHWRRYRQIADALTRHGLGFLVGTFGIERVVPFHRGLLRHPRRDEPYTQPEHVRMALTDLGATAIKFGQILSTRSDLLSPEYSCELAKLQDAVPPVPFAELSETLSAELGRPIDETFASFDPEPLAAASIGQAHVATLDDGTEVVVKIRRPGVVEQVREDLEILKNLAAAAGRRWEAAEQYDLVALVDEFAEALLLELDYLREGRNAERLAANFADDSGLHVPRIFWETTTSRILTQERMQGLKVDDLEGLEAAGIDRKQLAMRLAGLLLKMIFEDGFYHADPHPGNFFIQSVERIRLIDFGMMGTVDDRTRQELAAVLMALSRNDIEELVEAVRSISGTTGAGVDRTTLSADLERLVSDYGDRPLGNIPIAPVVERYLAILREHRMQLPSRFALLLKTIMMAEGLGLKLDPQFSLTSLLVPYAKKLCLEQYSPAATIRRLEKGATDAARLVEELPGDLRRVLRAIDEEGLPVRVRERGLERLGDQLDAGPHWSSALPCS
jgi:ubiquinone biosynthesis protein